ncbi:MAG: SusC/RagA family TonB-linked outer membrane protein [Chitinophagaceae bacterium]
MKLVTIIIFAACLTASARTNSQTVSLSGENVPLTKLFSSIESQTDYVFFFDYDLLKDAKNVTIKVKHIVLLDALKLIFNNQPLDFSIKQKTIVITKREKVDKIITSINTFIPPPPIDIHGTVTNETGEPLVGISVKVKGTDNGTSTNENGEFSLTGVDNNATLVFTGINIESFETKVNGRSGLALHAKTKVAAMQEVVVNKGYYTEKQKYSVSNVTTVTAKDIEKQPVQNPLLALQGRVPGLFVLQPSGLAGSSVKVRIQGQNSIANGNEPLYVVDGVPIDPQLPRTGIDNVLASFGSNFSGWGSPLSYINVSDIESIDVLKDADATAIYGSRGANGVILITTKKGKAGTMRLDVNMQTGFGQVARKLDMMNTSQYIAMRQEAFRNDGINWKDPSVSADDLKVWDTTRYTDWQKKLIGGTANNTTVSVNVSGGTALVRYLVGGTYHKETTVFPYPDDFADTKASVHFNLDANSANQKFGLQFSGNYIYDRNKLPRTDLTEAAIRTEPNAPALYNVDGTINWAPDITGTSTFPNNPMVGVLTKYENKTYNLISNLVLHYTILPGLEMRNSIGFNKLETDDYIPSPLASIRPENRVTTQRSAAYGARNIESWNVESQLNYTKKIADGKIDILIGSTLLDLKTNAGYLFGTGYLSDELLPDFHSAANIGKGISGSSEYKYNAAFTRVNYILHDKYIVNLTARRDGSSRFGGANRFHNFGSAGAAWIFSGEKFIRDKFRFLSFGKLKGSFGTTGSDQIGDYSFLSLYNLYSGGGLPYQGTTGLVPSGLPNQHLQWEETKKLQIGIDFGFFNDRINVNATYVRNRSSNQLLRYPLPTVAGFTSYLLNFDATIQNKNWEFSVNTTNIKEKNLTWTSSINLTIPQNKLVAFPNLSSSTYSNSLVIGQPVTIQKVLHFVGVDPTTGNYIFGSKTDAFNPKFPDDYTVPVNTAPKFYGGLQNNITYKGFELDFLFQFVKQLGFGDALVWNGNRYPGGFYPGASNQPQFVLSRWQKPGDNAPVKKYSTREDQFILKSDYRFTDASYIRLKNASLSWNLPIKFVSKAHFKKCRVYIHGQNLLTLTNYKGLDPENQGLYTISLPPLRIWTVGLQLGL